jgi:hypothetical protein
LQSWLMVHLFPFRFELLGRRYLVTDESGDFFFTTHAVLERLVFQSLIPADEAFLLKRGFAFIASWDFYYNSFPIRCASGRRSSLKSIT